MVQNIGNALTHTATGHRPLPRTDASSRPGPHAPQTAKRGGFDWDWNKGTCSGCGTKVAKPQLVDGRCPVCRGEQAAAAPAAVAGERSRWGDETFVRMPEEAIEERFTAPTRPVPVDDDQSPAAPAVTETAVVVEAVARLGDVVGRVTRPAQHAQPAVVEAARSVVAELPAMVDRFVALAHELADLTGPLLDALHDLDHQTPAAPSDRPRTAVPRATTAQTLGGHGLDKAAIVAAYQAGDSMQTIARAHHVHKDRIRDVINAAGCTIHGRGTAMTATRDRLADLGVTAAQVKAWALTHGLIAEITVGPASKRLVDAYVTAHPTDPAATDSTVRAGDTR